MRVVLEQSDKEHSEGLFAGARVLLLHVRPRSIELRRPELLARGAQLSIGANSGVDTEGPAFQLAQTSCKHLLPGGGPGSGPPSPEAMAHMLQVSECMRAHGISGFPDPTTKLPSHPSDYSGVMDHNGAVLAIPYSIDPQSPAFEQAAAACNFGPKG